MTWAKFDDRFPSNLKILRLSDRAFRLFVTSVCFCCEQLTDGRIEIGIPEALPRAPARKKLADAIAELEAMGLWERVQNGWIIHDFLDWNPTSEDVRAKREARRASGRLGGKRSADVRAKREQAGKQPGKQTLEQTASKLGSKTEANSNPVPVPVPERDPPYPPRPDPLAQSLTGGGSARRADVLRVFELFREAVAMPGLSLGRYGDPSADILAEAIDRHGESNCMLVAADSPNDRMVNGEADERGMSHKSVSYVFGNPTAFARILAAATSKRTDPGRKTIMETMREALAAEPDLSGYVPPEQRGRAS
jgi:hypothetical protein